MSGARRSPFLARAEWSPAQLDADRAQAQEQFRRERLEEPLEAYLDGFEHARDAMGELLARTADLARIEEQAAAILADPAQQEALRYLPGPPISLDDLKVLVDAGSLSPQALRRDPELVRRLAATIRAGLDGRRFPWVAEGRGPTAAERETAITASAALIAAQRVATHRRTAGKQAQEEQVRQELLRAGLRQIDIPGRDIPTLREAPRPGEFCPEARLGSRKADLIVGLWDGRVMPIECKVSNSSTNSVKRLNNDAAVKAEVWRHDFGDTQVVPVAVLGGVYKLHNLEEAQRRGLTLYWAHRLGDLIAWIEQTHTSSGTARGDAG
ncbi:MAG TPA: XamI family restriction endonuclease [Thermomicrobiales bacterium]|nr:XamI family restriction endonuclease [Thermomicrobiales bacterium]